MKTLEETNAKNEKKLTTGDTERQKMKKEKVEKARATKESTTKLESSLKVATQAKKGAEKKKVANRDQCRKISHNRSSSRRPARDNRYSISILVRDSRCSSRRLASDIRSRTARGTRIYMSGRRRLKGST